ncbi:MAG: hypothetical protein K2M19_07615 [Muribaculaceae bacterium]|nr:hypothetical protein [Muribaculaceae bacterium]
MKTKQLILTVAFALTLTTVALPSCLSDMGKGDARDCNLEQATLARLDSIHEVEYIGMSDVRDLDSGRCQAVVIYQVTDSSGNKAERNARVTTNEDFSMIIAWEDLDGHILEDVKQKVSDKMKEKGIDMDGSLIDELIKLKKQTR